MCYRSFFHRLTTANDFEKSRVSGFRDRYWMFSFVSAKLRRFILNFCNNQGESL
jgi:hypothetical protein